MATQVEAPPLTLGLCPAEEPSLGHAEERPPAGSGEDRPLRIHSSKQQKEESNQQERDGLLRGTSDIDEGPRREFIEAPPPRVNPWTKQQGGGGTVNGQTAPEPLLPTKVVKAGNPPRTRKGSKVGDFGDATNWPTPGEIAHKSIPPSKLQVVRKSLIRKEMKEEKGDGKENQRVRSDESGEEKNGDDENQKSGQKKRGNKYKWVPLQIDVKAEVSRDKTAARNNRQNEQNRHPIIRNEPKGEESHREMRERRNEWHGNAYRCRGMKDV